MYCFFIDETMKFRNPMSSSDLTIHRGDRVLEIGPGHNPFYRADVVLEKFIDTNYHRCGDVKVYDHQVFYHADGGNLPFKDKEFDYIYCSNVLEHVEDPVAFLKELSRVGKRGYIETPSIIGESFFPKESHKWCIADIDGQLVLYEKSRMPGNYGNDYGEALLNYLPYVSLPYRLLNYTGDQIFFVRYEWKDSVDCIVNPESETADYFEKKWNRSMCEKIFPHRSVPSEICRMFKACLLIAREKCGSHRHGSPMPLSEYVKTHEIIHYGE